MSYLLDLLYPKVKLEHDLFKLSSPRALDCFDSVLPVFHYHKPLSEYLHLLKYARQFTLADDLAKITSKALSTYFPNILAYWRLNNFILVPVPLHWSRRNWRGFNQAELLAKNLSRCLSLNYQQNWLLRTHYGLPQVKLNKIARLQNPKSAFTIKLSSLENITNSSGNFLLVDDVVTTGSTLISAVGPLLPFTKNLPWGLTIAG